MEVFLRTWTLSLSWQRQPKGTNEAQLRGLQSVVHAHSAGTSDVEVKFVVRIISIYYCS